MKTKLKLSILAFLSGCAVVSMGFANWVISQGPVSVSGSLRADNIVDSSDYFADINVSMLSYNSEGFTGVDNPLVGSVTYSFTLKNLNELETRFGGTSVVATVSMAYYENNSEYNLFSDLYSDESHYIEGEMYSNDFDEINTTTTYGADLIKVSGVIDFADVTTENIEIAVTFTMDFKDKSNFENYLYNPLKDNKISFVFNATLEGGVK